MPLNEGRTTSRLEKHRRPTLVSNTLHTITIGEIGGSILLFGIRLVAVVHRCVVCMQRNAPL